MNNECQICFAIIKKGRTFCCNCSDPISRLQLLIEKLNKIPNQIKEVELTEEDYAILCEHDDDDLTLD